MISHLAHFNLLPFFEVGCQFLNVGGPQMVQWIAIFSALLFADLLSYVH
jgi:hypothetical protein